MLSEQQVFNEQQVLSEQQKSFYESNGYVLVEGLFSKDEVAFYKNHYMHLRETNHEGDFSGVDSMRHDPLKNILA